MPTTFEQELAREQAAVTTAEQIKDSIKTVAENKGLTVEETDTPLSVLTKIDNSTIATPTETISITENGTVDVTNYASADVNVPSSTELPAYMSAKNFTFNGTACTGYVGDNSLPEIIIPKSYSTVTSIETVVGAKVLDKSEIRYMIRDFQSVTFSDGENNTHIYSSPMELDMLENDFPNDCYLVSMQCLYPFSFDFLQMASDMQILQFPIAINGQSFSDGMTAFDYIMEHDIINVNFDGEVEVTKFVDGDDFQVTKIVAINYNSGFINYNGKIILLNNINNIGDGAFYSCSKLKGVIIPESVSVLGNQVFYRCSKLISIELPDTITKLGVNLFNGCESLESVRLPSSLTSFPASIFRGTNLTSYTIPDKIETVDSDTFTDCKNLKIVYLNNNLTTIGNSMFYGCVNLNTLVIGRNVSAIQGIAFAMCGNLKNIIIDENNVNFTVENGAIFNTDKSILVRYPSAISYNIPETVSEISSQCFQYSRVLTNIVIPNTVTIIGMSAFSNCNNLKTITMSENITTIAQNTFFGCSSLTNIEIPSGVTSIGDNAFFNCSSLITITVLVETPPTIQTNTFRNVPNTTIYYVPDISVEAYKTATNWSRYADQIQPLSEKGE